MAWMKKGLCLSLIALALPGALAFTLPNLPLLSGVGHGARGSYSPAAQNFRGVTRGRVAGSALTQGKRHTPSLAHGLKMASSSGTRILVPADRYSSTYWMNSLLSTFLAPTWKRIASHIFTNVLVSIMVYIAYLMYPQSTLLKGLPLAPHLLLGNAMGLLLVFRTNSAYDRFWEARKIWGSMISRIRILAHFAHRSMTGLDREHVLTLLAAMPAVFLHHLRGWNRLPTQHDEVEFLVQAVGEDDAVLMWKAGNRPLILCKMISAIIHRSLGDSSQIEAKIRAKNANYPNKGNQVTALDIAVAQAELTSQRNTADSQVGQLVDAIGSAERIVKTTVPVSYSRHTSRFLSIWCFTLPVVLVESLGWRLIPVIFFICWALFTIEEVGHIIEDPFNMPQPNPMDDLKFENSFPVIRDDVMERLPATDPVLRINNGDRLVPFDYDVADFHDYYKDMHHRNQARHLEREAGGVAAEPSYRDY